MDKITFDEWVALYKTNPKEYERKRKEVLDQEILKAPVGQRNRLRLLQMECDAYHNSLPPMEATIEISKLLVQKLEELDKQLQELKTFIK
jgi:hypothetical protein